VVKSILQLQKVQVVPLKTFKTAKEFVNREANEEKKLKQEVKKAFREAKKELKKDSIALHEYKQEQTEKRVKRDMLERKRVRRILNEEQAEFKAMQSQEMQTVKLPPKVVKKKRMAGNKTEQK